MDIKTTLLSSKCHSLRKIVCHHWKSESKKDCQNYEFNVSHFCFQVLLAQCSIHSEKCDKTCAEVEIDEHIECGCECKIKRHHCNAKQVCAMSWLVQLSLDIVNMVVRPFLFTKLSLFTKE